MRFVLVTVNIVELPWSKQKQWGLSTASPNQLELVLRKSGEILAKTEERIWKKAKGRERWTPNPTPFPFLFLTPKNSEPLNLISRKFLSWTDYSLKFCTHARNTRISTENSCIFAYINSEKPTLPCMAAWTDQNQQQIARNHQQINSITFQLSHFTAQKFSPKSETFYSSKKPSRVVLVIFKYIWNSTNSQKPTYYTIRPYSHCV